MARQRALSPHQRTRTDHATEVAEDYVEAIAGLRDERGECRVKHLAETFAVSHVTVVQTLRRLERDGFVVNEPRTPVELTEKGKRLARRCAERHDVVYRFLLALGIEEQAAAVDAEGIEHHVSQETLDRFRAFIDETGG